MIVFCISDNVIRYRVCHVIYWRQWSIHNNHLLSKRTKLDILLFMIMFVLWKQILRPWRSTQVCICSCENEWMYFFVYSWRFIGLFRQKRSMETNKLTRSFFLLFIVCRNRRTYLSTKLNEAGKEKKSMSDSMVWNRMQFRVFAMSEENLSFSCF